MDNCRLLIAYDGSNYKGWQKNNRDRTIEETLQKSLESILQHPVQLQAASRTDAGVHAHGQVVNFFTPLAPLSPKDLTTQINLQLPDDISVLDCQIARQDFHPTVSAKSKEYHYFVCCGKQLPHHRFYSWHCYSDLDVAAMREGAKLFVGRHDFSSFCNVRVDISYNDFTREVDYLTIEEIERNRLRFVIGGHSFLYKMVRNLVGTLVNIGQGKIPLEHLPKIIASKDRKQAGMTAPAHGLFLKQVTY